MAAAPPALSTSQLGLVASGGIYITGQMAFHYKDDTSWRVIPTDVKTTELRATHFAYDLTDARQDPNVVFPIDTLRGLVSAGVIGALAANAYTFMGGIYSAGVSSKNWHHNSSNVSWLNTLMLCCSSRCDLSAISPSD